MSATVLRQRVDTLLQPTQMVRVLREQDGLFALLGGWLDSAAVIGFAPAHRLAPDADPFAAITRLPLVSGSGSFGGGWVGAFGYRLGARLESLPPAPPRPVPLPDFSLAYYDHVLVHDSGGWWFEALVDDLNEDRIDNQLRLVQDLLQRRPGTRAPYTFGDFVACPDGPGHRVAVHETLRHLRVGDIFQANICRRLDARFDGDPLDVFCAGVESLAPKYAAFIRTSNGAVASFSPELFLHRVGRNVRTSPIKGTAPLDSNVEELMASAKNHAENVMIVDLMRNDLGRVCRPGSIKVEDIARAERHTGVWHLVSDVVGELAPKEDDASLLRATFPPGSVTGVPKVRAMEVIHEVETSGRETYTGAIGYVSPCAGLELNVAIRTFEFAAGRAWLGVGGGVVIGSTPEGELAETLVKAAPLIDAIGARLSSADREILAAERPVRRTYAGDPAAAALPTVDLDAGLFTTLLVADGRAFDLDSHLARLAASVAACYGSTLPADLGDRLAELARTLAGRHRVRVSVLPGGDGIAETEVTASPTRDGSREGWTLVPVTVPGGLGPHKYVDRRRLSALETPGRAWSATCEALVIDSDGSLLETGRGNIFVVTEGAVSTPTVDGRLLPGVTRQRVIEELGAVGIEVVQRRLTFDDVTHATEVFVTSSIDRVRQVRCIEHVARFPSGPLTGWLSKRLSSAGAPETQHRFVASNSGRSVRLLLIDNVDSFVYNLDQYVRELGAHTNVVRNNATSLDEIADAVEQGLYNGIIVSPGPGTPADAGVSTALIRRLGPTVPILGVCLGHQCVAEAYGARLVGAETILHGEQSLVHHDGHGVFEGLDGPLLAARYHSLVVSEETLPPDLLATAHTAGGVLMGIRHRQHLVEGVQIHPESILTRDGHHLLANFLRTCSRTRPAARSG